MNAVSEISGKSASVTLTVNGARRDITVEPRALLGDVLRDVLDLTGTHLGCEQGVCGACTVLVNGEPQRSCIAFAADCHGDEITTIEGFEADEVMAELRREFSACHALQCGFCTPGMLVTCRDIVLRLGEVDETKIRRELAGNLCRCTGYVGIVDAVSAVCAGKAPQKDLSALKPKVGEYKPVDSVPPPVAARAARTKGEEAAPVQAASKDFPNSISQTVALAIAPVDAWELMRDLHIVARCIPGAEIISLDDGKVSGQMHVALGPIKGRFAGEGEYKINDTDRTGMMTARGRDAGTGSSASGQVSWRVVPAGDNGTVVEVQLAWRLTGPLAQFNRGGIVRETVRRLAEAFAANLEKYSMNPSAEVQADVRPLGLFGLLSGVLSSWFTRVVRRKT
ncbi:2Fe-2S iron-sulfur cluster-binding protein [Aminobacter aminovorans]|uniref:Carbon-monoxide dehydrogenase small subunit n=1 Tax=Aminobacter aminovorans TaxID=83263 RepID=A0AAC9FES4_AMIAI|nr:2Fe-2S iron-sulfur cluster-binding protein [Aminobacter aminovorans]AMS45478.1 Ferredoxin:(2Fe-2S)-binding:carbon monoxide dehydrogenase subunit G [Aminobacter aminovorans]MBB3708685.1 carbon-monoxide dehydrogenase small subunit [Aminobacter aminovorans]